MWGQLLGENTFDAAYYMFEKYPQLSFADAASVAAMKDRGVQQIFSFDKGFGGVRGVVRLETV